MIRLAIIFGGKSIEYDNSLISAASVINAIDKSKYAITMIGIGKDGRWLLYDGPVEMVETGEWRDYAELKLLAEPEKYNFSVLSTMKSLKNIADVAFPILHGPKGEDGAVQGLLETIGIPYVGCTVLGSSLSMDKGFSKSMLKNAGIPVCRWYSYDKEEIEDNIGSVIDKAEACFSYPMFVKPACLGASIGVSKVKNRDELKAAFQAIIEIDRRVIIEEAIDAREVEVGIIGNFVPLASAVGEVVCSREFYDYEAKLSKEDSIERIIPAKLPEELTIQCKNLAIKAYKVLGLRGFARVDFFIERNTNKIYVNEVNAIPAFADNCMFPALWEAVGLAYSELIDRIIGYGMEK